MIEKSSPALAGVAQWTERWPANPNVLEAGSAPSQGTCLGCGPSDNQSMYLSHIGVSLPLFIPSFPLSKNK